MRGERIASNVRVSLRAGALEAICRECDRYDRDETGGRILGVYQRERAGSLHIDVTGVIEPGPRARRTPTSFFQDGAHQSEVFRRLEAQHPDIEHLGNWHTHHVNGVPTLSGGDIDTYQRTVNHKKHNLDFFYALLVVARNSDREGLERYRVRHYLLYRNDANVYEVAPTDVTVVDEPIIWPVLAEPDAPTPEVTDNYTVRARDKYMLRELYPEVRPFFSKKAGALYWKGRIRLIDDSVVEIVVPEMKEGMFDKTPQYVAAPKQVPDSCADVVEWLRERKFASASRAIRYLEDELNRAMFQSLQCSKDR